MQLLIDEALEMETSVVEELNEATGTTTKNYYIHGTFSTPDKKNRNGRVYSSKLWETNVEEYQTHIKENTKYTLGELEHPTRVDPDPMLAVMKIVELKMEDGVVKGKAKILNDNSKETNKLKALIDEGYKIGVSSRGTGRMKGSIVEEFKLSTYDIVQSPSDYNAMLSGITESTEAEVHLNESTGQYICDEKGCSLKTALAEGTPPPGITPSSPCTKNANTLLENLNAFVKEPKELSEAEKLARSLFEKKAGSADAAVTKLIKNLKKEIKKALDAGAIYGNVDKLERELKDVQEYLRNSGVTESMDEANLEKELQKYVDDKKITQKHLDAARKESSDKNLLAVFKILMGESKNASLADKLLASMKDTKAQREFERANGSVYKMSKEELEKHLGLSEGDTFKYDLAYRKMMMDKYGIRTASQVKSKDRKQLEKDTIALMKEYGIRNAANEADTMADVARKLKPLQDKITKYIKAKDYDNPEFKKLQAQIQDLFDKNKKLFD